MKARSPQLRTRPRTRAAALATAALASAGLLVAVQYVPEAAAATVPSAAKKAVISGDARFEVLSPTLIRSEYAGNGHFTDAATFNAIGRDDFGATRFTTSRSDGWLIISTSAMTLRYRIGSGQFGADNLQAVVRNGRQDVHAQPWASTLAPTCTVGVRCEAEALQLSGLAVDTNHADYTGSGFVGGFEHQGNSLTFTTTVPSDGSYDVAARYANSQGGDGKIETRTLSVSADGGAVSTISLPNTANWDTWAVARTSLNLTAGTHTITVARGANDSGDVNFDNVAVLDPGADYPAVATPTPQSCAFGSVCEAETGAFAGGARVASDHNDHSGAGFVAGLEQAGASDTITVTGVKASGDYVLQLRYANYLAGAQPLQSRTMTIGVGAHPTTTATLAPTSSWDAWRIQSIPVHLDAGTDQVTLGCPTSTSCNVNVDTVAFASKSAPVLDPHAPLGGYRRSLDQVDGGALTTPGLLYQDGWSLLNDTASALYDPATRTVTPRPATDGTAYQDGYLFGYGKGYTRGLKDLSTLTGASKLLPRWAYGVWYSEYYDRTAAQFENTILPAFRQQKTPLDVLVTDTDFKSPNTWNGWEVDSSKFPDMKAYDAWAHQHGLHTGLNIHPSIAANDPHFAQAQEIAKGKLQPGSCGGGVGDCYAFDFGDPDQLKAYLWLHTAMNATGNDLWWMDWCCDSSTSSLTGVTGDAWINQAYADYTAKTLPRGFAFSRAYGSLDGGYGNNNTSPTGPWADKRTTLHFTGDTISDWSTLAFEVGYTPGESAATGMSSISHDIGGHTGGTQTAGSEPGSTKLADDLYARWVQFGTFQPVDRLHSNHSDRLPWQYGTAARTSAEKFLNLREKLVPYTYSLAQQATATGTPIVRPLYLQYPDQQEAYAQANAEYLYGPDVLVAPVTTPGSSATTKVWLPAGSRWTDWFTGRTYAGGRTVSITTGLGSMPVFIRSGGVVVTRTHDVSNDVQHPAGALTVTAARGAGSMKLYEDNGSSASTRHAFTTIRVGDRSVRISGAVGTFSGQVARRVWTVAFVNASAPHQVRVDGRKVTARSWSWNRTTHVLTVHTATRSVHRGVTVSYR